MHPVFRIQLRYSIASALTIEDVTEQTHEIVFGNLKKIIVFKKKD